MKDQLYVVAQSLQQPRVVKRIIEKSAEYKKVKVYGFKRDFYNVDNSAKLADYPNVEVIIIGLLRNEQYLHRLFLYLKLLFLLNVKTPFGRKEIYTFGLDLRFICCFFFNSDISYEIADIMWLYRPKTARKILSRIDFFLSKRSKQVIFTSEGFYRRHYAFLPEEQVLIIENRFKTYGKVKPLTHILTDKIRLAYIGSFRYANIIAGLIRVVQRHPEYELDFYGDGFADIVEGIKTAANTSPNVHYHGPYKNPGDLESIYANTNLNFAAYDNTLDNEKVAMPNKFYESGYFNVPIVCATGTFVGEKTIEMKMGWIIEPDEKSIEDFLGSISINDLVTCHERIKTMDRALFEVK
jgi:succinoglycan biosynthesis protein ExoL